MKKLVLFMTASLAMAISSSAQTSQVATLSNGETIKTYYSANALKDAYNDANEGDVITLSAGSFIATNFEKNITVRGAGMMLDNNPTIINGNIDINCTVNENTNFTLEGAYINGKIEIRAAQSPRFIKCFIGDLHFNMAKNATIIHCDIRYLNTDARGSNSSGSFIGCHILGISVSNGVSSLTFANCDIVLKGTGYHIDQLKNATIKNCIIEDCEVGDRFLPSSSVATYCYYVGKATDPFKNCISTTNKVLPSDTNYQKEGSTTYELPDELATTWLGEDGTQVGMHGGAIPFDPTPTNPQITKFNVASKTTADGKLSVDIEVKAN